MGAKQKLNAHYMLGSVVTASLIGGAFASWPIFFVALTALVGASVAAGDIRK